MVSRGSGIPFTDVRPGNLDWSRPEELPAGTFATLLWLNDQRTNYPADHYVVDHTARTAQAFTLHHRRVFYSLTFYRGEARFKALLFEGFLDTPNGKTFAETRFLAVKRPLVHHNPNEIVGDAFEERAVIDLEIDYVFTTVQDAGYVDEFDIALCLTPFEEVRITPDA